MKTADLKRELERCGLPLFGDKKELQKRLQMAMLESYFSDSGFITIYDYFNDSSADLGSGSSTEEDEKRMLNEELDDIEQFVCKDQAKNVVKIKLSELNYQERLDMRAKKFGIITYEENPIFACSQSKYLDASMLANRGEKVTEEQQKEALKRRAERFGLEVPEKQAKTCAEMQQERLQRFQNPSKEDIM